MHSAALRAVPGKSVPLFRARSRQRSGVRREATASAERVMSAPVPDLAIEIKIRSSIHGLRTWRRSGVRAHVTRDGREMILAVWETPCVICGEPFEILSMMKVERADQCHSWKLTTCPPHRLTLSESTALRFARGDCRRTVFEMIRRDKPESFARARQWLSVRNEKWACPSQRTRPYSTETRQGPTVEREAHHKAICPKSATRNSWTGPALQEPIELVSTSEVGAATSREHKHLGVSPPWLTQQS